MKKNIWIVLACTCIQTSMAQVPKWAEKAKKAVFSIVTYDKDNKMKNTGNGFYIDEMGNALSDYTLFENAERAVIITADGKQKEVQTISGVNSLYDVIKFETASEKKQVFLPIAQTPAQVGETVYLLPYSTQKSTALQKGKVTSVDSIGNNSFYYTLEMKTGEKMVSCPIVNMNGEVLGMIQKNASDESEESYAIGAGYGASLSITALLAGDTGLNAIGISKKLPDTEEQALAYLYMALPNLTDEGQKKLVDDFIKRYPKNVDGYIKRVLICMSEGDEQKFEEAENDFITILKVAENKDDAFYQIAKTIHSYVLSLEGAEPYEKWTYERALELVNNIEDRESNGLYAQLEGDLHFAMKHYPEAFACYERVNQSELVSPDSYYSAAKTKHLMEGSDINEVIALMDSAIVRFIKPYTQDAAPYIYERAGLYMEAKKYRDAVLDYNTFHDILNGNVNALFYYQREQAEMQCRMYQQAIDDINRAVEMEPNDLDYWLEKGAVHMRVNQHNEAEAALRKAVAIDGNSATAHRMLGYCLALQKKNDEACPYFQKAKDLGDTVVDQLIEKYCK